MYTIEHSCSCDIYFVFIIEYAMDYVGLEFREVVAVEMSTLIHTNYH